MGTTLNFVVTKTRVGVSAQCLEQDLIANASTLEAIEPAIRGVVTRYLTCCRDLGINPWWGDPAPRAARALFDASTFHIAPGGEIAGIVIVIRVAGELPRVDPSGSPNAA